MGTRLTLSEEHFLELSAKYPQLTPDEIQALHDFNTRPDMSSLVLSKAETLYPLFLRHRTCAEITRLNKGISLGQVVDARIQHNWDERRAASVDAALDHAHMTVRLSQAEMAGVIADLLSVQKDLWKTQIDRYLQNKDPAELAGLPIGGVRNVKDLMAILQDLTTPGNKAGAVTVNVNSNPAGGSKPDPKNTVTVTVEPTKSDNPVMAIAKRLKAGKNGGG
jgi:hypothetical protein